MRGKFIAKYGKNNLGKSTQAKKTVEWLVNHDIPAEYLKYPIYDLEPFGPMINGYLRSGNPYGLTPFQVQTCYMLNRDQYQPSLIEKLESGIWIIAEDYVGTGIAWGVAAGVPKDYLVTINQHLIQPDLAFLFEGERFAKGIEKIHLHEQDNDLTERSAVAHQDLALEYGWISIHANRTEDQVFDEIISTIKYFFELE